MEFQYKAVKTSGEVIEGLFDSKSKQEVVDMLKGIDCYPISIGEKKKTGTKEININRKVKANELAFFCRQLNAMLNAGSTISKSLDIMKRQITNKLLKEAVTEMYTDVQKGTILSESLKKYPKIFPELMIYMVESGEISGTLDIILLRLATYFEKESSLRNKLKSAMVYPVILMIVSVVVVIFLTTFILPTFVTMFEGSDVPLPGITRALLDFSTFLRGNGLLVTVVTLIVGVLFYQYFSTIKGKRVIDWLKLKVPVVRDLTVKTLTARFSRNLATMLSSGVPLLAALKNISKIINNQIISEAIMGYHEGIQKGNDLHLMVRESGYFPPMLDGMMEIGKESGALDDILDKTADYYDDEVETAIDRLTAMFEPFMILVLAFVIGFIVVAMALPMFDMFQTVGIDVTNKPFYI